MSAAVARIVSHFRHRPYVSACLGLLIVLAAANYWLWSDRRGIEERLDASKQKGEFMLRALSGRGAVDANLTALREAVAQIETNLLDEQSMEVNLGYFYRFERTARVKLVRLNQLSSQPPQPGSKFKVVSFSLQIVGTYRNNMTFIRALESGSRILRIRSCSIERMEKDAANLTLDLMVDVLAKA